MRRGTVVCEVLLRPDNSPAAHLKEGHREQGGVAVTDLRHRRHAIGTLVDSLNLAAPGPRIALVESDKFLRTAYALASVRPVCFEVLGQQGQGVPESPLVKTMPELYRHIPALTLG